MIESNDYVTGLIIFETQIQKMGLDIWKQGFYLKLKIRCLIDPELFSQPECKLLLFSQI